MTYRMLGGLIALVIIAIDQLQKWHMLEVVRIAERPPIEVTSFFNLVMVWNEGVSFGLFSGHGGAGVWFLIALALAISTAMAIWLWRAQDRFISIAISFVIGGALGNVIDRVRFGAVADFFDFHYAGWHYPAFNIADSAIFIGVALLLWDSFFRQPRAKKPSKEALHKDAP
jgi:signal peptidase II